MTQSIWQHAGRAPDHFCDVAIVGGGVVGCATAYWISRLQPDRHVVIVEAGAVAGGASGRNAGFLLQGALSDHLKDCAAYGREAARRLWRFTRENRDMLFSELDGSAFELESSGSLVVAGSHEEDRRLRACVGIMRSHGAPSTYFTPEETNRRLASVGFGGSLYVPSGGMLNPVALVRHLAALSGAQLCEHASVRSIERRQNGIAVETDRRTICADRVVVAINAWLPQLFPLLARYVRPVRAQMFSTRASSRRWLDVPVYSHDGCYYARQSKHGVFLVGGARYRHADDEVGFDDVVTEGVQEDLEAYVRAHFPEALEVERRWSGVMGFSPDHLPVVGELPDLPGSVWAGGFSGHGMGYGFRFGRLLAEMVAGRTRPDGLELFTTERFAEPSVPRVSPSDTRRAAF